MTILELMWEDAIAIARRTGGRPGALPKMPAEQPKRPAKEQTKRENVVKGRNAMLSIIAAVAFGDRTLSQITARTGYSRDYAYEVARDAGIDGMLEVIRKPGLASVYAVTPKGRAWLEAQG